MGWLVLVTGLILSWIVNISAQDLDPNQYAAPPRNISIINYEHIVYFASFIKAPIKFKCDAAGNPRPRYVWKKNGVAVNNRAGEIHVDGATGDLEFINPKLNTDPGHYQCFASNKYGEGMSAKFELRAATLGGFPQEQQATMSTGKELSYHFLKCTEKPKSVPDPVYQWNRGKQNPVQLTETNRIAVDRNGTLHFLNLQQSDKTQTGRPYLCAVLNSIAGMQAFGSSFQLFVDLPDSLDPTAPVARHDPNEKIVAMVGETAMLECIFSGNPAVTITWQDVKRQPIQGRSKKMKIENFGRRLTITNVTLDDEGAYGCQATNSQGIKDSTVTLDVIAPPIWKEPIFKSQTVPVGENAVFTCKAESPPNEPGAEGPVWLKNTRALDTSDTTKYELSRDMQTLTVKNVQKPLGNSGTGDNMCIQCLWKNKYGETFHSAALVVIDQITVLVKPDAEYVIKAGDILRLAAHATAGTAITLQYKWFYNETKMITNTNEKVFMLSDMGKNLTIDTRNIGHNPQGIAQDFDSLLGLYTLEISHDLDKKVIPFRILKEAVVTPIVQAAGNLWLIAIVLGILVILIIVLLIICLLYRNRGGEYPVDEKEVKAGHDPEKELADSGFHDLSRADNDDYEKSPKDTVSLSESVKPIESDDDEFGEYGDVEFTKFNEDGSFIGIYGDKKGRHQPTQSAV